MKRDQTKTIPISYLGEGHEKIWGTTIEIKGIEGETTVSIDNFKEAIPKDKYDKVNAWYWKNGIGRALTEKPIRLDEVDKVEFVRKKEEVHHSPTPTPSLTSSPSVTVDFTPDPPLTVAPIKPKAFDKQRIKKELGICIVTFFSFIICVYIPNFLGLKNDEILTVINFIKKMNVIISVVYFFKWLMSIVYSAAELFQEELNDGIDRSIELIAVAFRWDWPW
ncbi:MAG: hypothetical protein LBM93_09210 [Oscillospiraceae bacterium]|nr:hypothetical protein [Oscillospiraceae bacterium]